MGDRFGFERELSLLRGPDAVAPAMVVRDREIANKSADLDGYFSTLDRKAVDAAAQTPALGPRLRSASIRFVLKPDRCFVRVEGDSDTHVFPITLSKSTAGFYYVEWSSTCNPHLIIDIESGKTLTSKPWSDPLLAGENQVRPMRCQRKGLIWVTQAIGEVSSTTKIPEEFPLGNYPSYTYDEAQEFIKETVARPLIAVGEQRVGPQAPGSNPQTPRSMVTQGLTGGIFYSGRYYDRPLNFTYWTHNGTHTLVSRRYLCNDKDKTQCTDFYFLVPIVDIEDFLRFWPLQKAAEAAAGMVLLWQIVMEIGVYFIPVFGPIFGLIQTTRGVVNAYKNWDKMKGWEKALVGIDVLMTVIPGGKAVIKAGKGVGKVDDATEALMKAGLPKAEARRLSISSHVLLNERKTLQAVDKLQDSLREGKALTVHELVQVEKAYEALLKGLPKGEALLQRARVATHDLDSAKAFFKDVSLTETHLAGLRALTPEILVTLRATAEANSTIVKQVIHAAGQSNEVAWGLIHLQTAVKGDHLAHIAASLGEGVMRDLGRGTVSISPELAKMVKSVSKLEDAYGKLMTGGKTWRLVDGKRKVLTIEGLASTLQKSRPRPLAADLAAIEKRLGAVFLTEGQLKGVARLDASLQLALGKGARPADVHRIASIASYSNEAAAVLNDVGRQIIAAKPAKFTVTEVLGKLDPGFVDLMAKAGVRPSQRAVELAATRVGHGPALVDLLEGSRRTKPHIEGLYDQLAVALEKMPNPQGLLSRLDNRVRAGELFARWTFKNPDEVQGVASILVLKKATAQEKIKGIYTGFPDNYQNIFGSIGELHRKFDPSNLGALVDNLATAAITKFKPEIAQGGTLTLAYALKNMRANADRVFELTLQSGRKVDLVIGDVYIECKLWSHFSGNQVAAAAKEFAQDIEHMLKHNRSFGNIRWVFSENMRPYRSAIIEMMEDVILKSPIVAKAAAAAKRDVTHLRDSLRSSVDKGFLEFF